MNEEWESQKLWYSATLGTLGWLYNCNLVFCFLSFIDMFPFSEYLEIFQGFVFFFFTKLTHRVAPHSSTLAWRIPWAEEPGRLQSIGLRSVGHDWATSLSLSTFMHWRRKWQPTPLFLPGESQGWRSLVGCHLCGRTESDTTEAT